MTESRSTIAIADAAPGGVVWPTTIAYVAIHAACLAVIWVGASTTDLVVCGASYVIRMFALSAGYHRYFAHRAFKTSRAGQFLLALLGTLGVQRGALWWASRHRHHHRYSDTADDIHSPLHQGFAYSHSGWFLDRRNADTDLARVQDLARFPELLWLDRWNVVPVVAFGTLLWLGFGTSGFVWGFCVSTVLLWHAIHAIGSFGHRFGGYRRFATTDNSRNKWFLGVVLLGEGWHNNHHFYPASARTGYRWWEVDPVYWVLCALRALGLVWDVREPPRRALAATAPREQAQVRHFERWLMGLRADIRAVLAAATAGRMLHEAVELHLDDFGARATAEIIQDPEALGASLSVLRSAVGAEIAAREGAAAMAAAVDRCVVGAVHVSPLATFLERATISGALHAGCRTSGGEPWRRDAPHPCGS